MIGLFDSGSGGLSVLTALRKVAPHADIAYFGDIKNAPYGIKSAHELKQLAYAGIATLKTMRANEIVAACNSVSPLILQGAAENTPVIEMSLPTAKYLHDRAGQRMLLMATPATITSDLYQCAIGSDIELDLLPVSELAGAIEFGVPEQKIIEIVREAFEAKKGNTYDALILGCTHYPLVREIIEQETERLLGPISIIDPAEAVASEVLRRFNTKGMARTHFHISQDSAVFRGRAGALLGNSNFIISTGS